MLYIIWMFPADRQLAGKRDRLEDLGSVKNEHDYIVVGSGSAGSVVANRLSASGKYSVLLLEAGGQDSNFWINVPLALMRVIATRGLAWFYPTQATQNFGGRSIKIAQGKVLGGSSAINGMLYVRGQKEDFDSWRDAGCEGWGWDDALPLFRKSETLARGGDDALHGRHGELKLSWMDDLPPVSRAAMLAASEYGLPFNHDINSGCQDGVGYLLATIHKGRRQSSARAFLHPIRGKRPNLSILVDAHVQKILMSDGRASAVRVSVGGETVDLRANREIILCAGAIGSPKILQHSGIGDAEHLRSVGVDPLIHLPQVGENLQDHLFGHLKFAVRSREFSFNHILSSTPRLAGEFLRWYLAGKGVLATSTSHFCGFFRSATALARPDLQLAMRPYSAATAANGALQIDGFPAITMSAIQTRPFSRGHVRIWSGDSFERPSVDANYLADDRDVQALVGGLRQIRKIATMPALQDIITEELEPGISGESDRALLDYLRGTATTVAHPAGTVRMGSDADAPLTPRLQLRGVAGLRVADASVMPVITSGNTNAPTIMIGEKAAEMILQDARA